MNKRQKTTLGKQNPQIIVGENEPKSANLTKRVLQRAITKGSQDLATKAMDVKGYVITVQNGWLVKKEKDGSLKNLSKLDAVKSRAKKIVLD